MIDQRIPETTVEIRMKEVECLYYFLSLKEDSLEVGREQLLDCEEGLTLFEGVLCLLVLLIIAVSYTQ